MNKRKFLNVFSLCFCLLFSCVSSSSNNLTSEEMVMEKDYSDYSEFYLTNIDDFYAQSGDYFIYLYSQSCPFCTSIKESVFAYLDAYKTDKSLQKPIIFNIQPDFTSQGNSNRLKFKQTESYDLNVMISQMVESKVSKLSDTYFLGTPSLYFISNNQIVNCKAFADVTDYFNNHH